jgi:hypothetical protein
VTNFKINATFLLLSGTFLLLTACQPEDASGSNARIGAEEKSHYLEKSEALAGQLQKALGSRLMAAIKEGGPVNGIGVCQRIAQDITRMTSDEAENISISRTALRVRNPVNQADPDSQAVLAHWQERLKAKKALRPRVTEKEGSVIVHRPIMTAAICLQCHGPTEQIDKETLAILKQFYPEDQATGFAEGDLRGAFRIAFTRR